MLPFSTPVVCFVGNILHAYAYNVNRFSFVAPAPTSPRQLRDLSVEPRKVAFPNGVVRREGCHAHHDSPPSAQRVQRLCFLASFPERVREFGVRHRQVALPARVAGVGLRQTLSDPEPVAERFQRLSQIALRHQHVADPIERHRQITIRTAHAWTPVTPTSRIPAPAWNT